MSNKILSDEEIKILSSNKYVKRVSAKSIAFTDEFLKSYKMLRQNGVKKRTALANFGLDLDIIGYSRIRGIDYRLQHNLQSIKKDDLDEIEEHMQPTFFSEKKVDITPGIDHKIISNTKNVDQAIEIAHIEASAIIGEARRKSEIIIRDAEKQSNNLLLAAKKQCVFYEQEAVVYGKITKEFKKTKRKGGEFSKGICYQIIDEAICNSNNVLSLKHLCDMLNVSRAGYYEWVKGVDRRIEKEEDDRMAFNLILQSYYAYEYPVGYDGIHMRMLHMQPPIIMNTKKIRRLVAKYGKDKFQTEGRKSNVCEFRRMDCYLPVFTNMKISADLPREKLVLMLCSITINRNIYFFAAVLDVMTSQCITYRCACSKDTILLEISEDIDELNNINDDAIVFYENLLGNTSQTFSIKELKLNRKLQKDLLSSIVDISLYGTEHFLSVLKSEAQLGQCDSFFNLKVAINNYLNYYNKYRYVRMLNKLSPDEFYESIIKKNYKN